MADHTERIAEIQEILRTGVKKVTTDGTTTEYDFAALRGELRRLMADDNTHRGRRPVVSAIKLDGF